MYSLSGMQKITTQIMKHYNPQKIILFGSFAWGKPTKDSDIDLFIIKETKQDQLKRIPEVRACLHQVDMAFDVLVMTPREVKNRLKMGDFFIEDILKKGKVLYEAKHGAGES